MFAFLRAHHWPEQLFPAFSFEFEGAFPHQPAEQRMNRFGFPMRPVIQGLDDLIGRQGRPFPDRFHNDPFGIGNLRQGGSGFGSSCSQVSSAWNGVWPFRAFYRSGL